MYEHVVQIRQVRTVAASFTWSRYSETHRNKGRPNTITDEFNDSESLGGNWKEKRDYLRNSTHLK